MSIEISPTFSMPLFKLISTAVGVHQKYFKNSELQASSLLSIKTGGCPENCAYCPQSAHYKTGVEKTKVMDVPAVVDAARFAKAQGASRFCMGAAWREIKDGPDFDKVLELVTAVKHEGLEVCCTLGMLKPSQAERLKNAGLDFYNHNIDTSEAYYDQIIQTRDYNDRLSTLSHVRSAEIKVCTGGILGMGETENDRISFITTLVNMTPQPESITINLLIPIAGTPLENAKPVETFDLLRVIATLRILAPQSMIRLSAGRKGLSDDAQLLCFLCGANSIFLGEKLLTSPNPETLTDQTLLKKLGLECSLPQAYGSP